LIVELDLVNPELDCVVVYLLAYESPARVGNQTVCNRKQHPCSFTISLRVQAELGDAA
jgi:hypothetical protein